MSHNFTSRPDYSFSVPGTTPTLIRIAGGDCPTFAWANLTEKEAEGLPFYKISDKESESLWRQRGDLVEDENGNVVGRVMPKAVYYFERKVNAGMPKAD